jgi:protein KRI1
MIGAHFLLAFQELDLEGDWDPDAHDRQMSSIFQMEDEGPDEDKPDWDDDIDIDDIIPLHTEGFADQKGKKKKRKKKETKEEEDEVDVDAMDADITQPEEEWDGTEEMRKRKLDEYMDELYGLEFNDMVRMLLLLNSVLIYF